MVKDEQKNQRPVQQEPKAKPQSCPKSDPLIKEGVRRVFSEYGEVIRKLGKE